MGHVVSASILCTVKAVTTALFVYCSYRLNVVLVLVSPAADQSVYHFLQHGTASWAAGKEDHRAWLLLLLHSLTHESAASQSCLSWLSAWPWSQPGLFRYTAWLFLLCLQRYTI